MTALQLCIHILACAVCAALGYLLMNLVCIFLERFGERELIKLYRGLTPEQQKQVLEYIKNLNMVKKSDLICLKKTEKSVMNYELSSGGRKNGSHN